MSLTRSARRALTALAAFVSHGAHADATTCVKPHLRDAFPADGARRVPLDAHLGAHYEATAQYSNEDVLMARGDGVPEGVPVVFDATQGLLSVVPPKAEDPASDVRRLAGDEDYVIEWPRLRGLGTASLGRGARVAFHTGSDVDRENPSFEGLTDLEWDVDRVDDGCTDSLEERFVFDLTPGAAADDSGRDSLALAVFLARGPDVGARDAPKPVMLSPLPEAGKKIRIEQSISAASGFVCFAAQVQDLAQHRSNGAEKQVCVTTTPPPFFYGCRIGSPTNESAGRSNAMAALLFVAVVLTLGARRRRSGW